MSDTPRGTTVVTFPLAVLTAAVLIATAAVTFFAMVRGEEETQVPAIIGEDLLAAMEQLQEKGLVPRVEGRFTSEVPIWHVVAQTPDAGSLVKAGRPVTVVVSRGRAVPEVGDYLGRDIDQVRLELQTLSATGESPIRIREDGPRITDPRPAGTILGQSPDPGTEVAEGLTIVVTVSRGPRGDLVTVPHFVGMTYLHALAELAQRNHAFVFTVRTGSAEDPPGTVVFQSPDGGSEVPHSTVLQVGITRPTPESDDQVFGMYEYEVEDYPILVGVTLTAEIPEQPEPVVLLETRSQGGPISVPFVAHRDARLALTVLGQQVDRRQAALFTID
jgi:beta-lactam-binding protein with PASTA domain